MFVLSLHAQEPSPIDRIDLFGEVRASGINITVVDSFIVGSGRIAGFDKPQGLYFTNYNSKGEILSHKYHYDSIQGASFSPNDKHELFHIGEGNLFSCTVNTNVGFCYTHNIFTQEFTSIDSIRFKYGYIFYNAIHQAQHREDLYVLGNALELGGVNGDPRQLGVLHYGEDTTLTVFAEEYFNLIPVDIFATGKDEWFVIANRENNIELYRKVNDEVTLVRKVLTNGPYEISAARNGLYIPGEGIFLVGYATPTGLPSRAIGKVDTLGQEVWRLSLEEYISVHEIFHRGIRTFVKNMIPAEEGDGVIFTGAEYIQESDSLEYAYGIVGKVYFDGNLQWLRRYRHIVGDKYENQFQDLVADGNGGYLLYGIVKDLSSRAAWLVRVDSEGLLIDTTTSTVEVITIVDKMDIYPNPASDIIYIKNIDSSALVYVYSLNGIELSKGNSENGIFNVSDLPSGNYILKTIHDGTIYTTKFTKL